MYEINFNKTSPGFLSTGKWLRSIQNMRDNIKPKV